MSVVLDLVMQGWKLKITAGKVELIPSDKEIHSEKKIVRNSHLIGRDAQLQQPSVRKFVKNMERRRLYSDGWHSIFSLMRDGQSLTEELTKINELPEIADRLEELKTVVSPYLQVVERDVKCEFTGLKLNDVWRYFRHTWINEYKSIPGRKLDILIRDRAAPNHPVIGIASLGSSVVQHRNRDDWIGWSSDRFIEDLKQNPKVETVKWLTTELSRLISEFYVKDLIKGKVLTSDLMESPNERIIKILMAESELSIQQHRLNPQKNRHKRKKSDIRSKTFWEDEAKSHLYRSKRCRQLAKLLRVRLIFQEFDLAKKDLEQVSEDLKIGKVKTAIAQLIRIIKGEHVGVDMMEITVCGAIAPYNHLLGGKLVCMLLCSPEVTAFCLKKYGEQESLIASSMRGQAVIRKPNVVLLCTTSLYGFGSSQYNRISFPVNQIVADCEGQVTYKNIGYSIGFGTYHFTNETIRFAEKVISRRKSGKLVNSVFGEGVNPLLRKLREAFGLLGLESEKLLLHGNKRVTYGIQLAKNFREILLGIENEPEYLIPQSSPETTSRNIAEYWKRRWLLQRMQREEVLEQVSKHAKSYPLTHGARVPLPQAIDKVETLFD